MRKKPLRDVVLETFREYGGWWRAEGMADWLNAEISEVRKIYDELEVEGLMERKR